MRIENAHVASNEESSEGFEDNLLVAHGISLLLTGVDGAISASVDAIGLVTTYPRRALATRLLGSDRRSSAGRSSIPPRWPRLELRPSAQPTARLRSGECSRRSSGAVDRGPRSARIEPVPRQYCVRNNSFDVGAVACILRSMRHVVRMVVAIRFALSTRRDLLLEILALRHQLHVLVRSNRRFRPSDRLLWLVLRQVWPRWTDALVLVQPATVERWRREGFHRCWRRRPRRPGRPRIDSECRGLIRRLAAENCLWGAPRIHGELLNLWLFVSERTVSRYLPDRLRAPSQTWRTFLANHLGQFTLSSPETSLDVPGGDDVVDGADLTFRQTPLSCDAQYASHQCAVGKRPSLQRTLPGKHIVHDHLHDRISIRTSSGRGPPPHGRFGRPTSMPGGPIVA